MLQPVTLHNADEFFGIGGAGGIAALLQALRPTRIVSHRNLEEAGVARFLQELRMVLVALFHAIILAETLILAVVVLHHKRSRPTCAHLDAKVVVGLGGQFTPSRSTFE